MKKGKLSLNNKTKIMVQFQTEIFGKLLEMLGKKKKYKYFSLQGPNEDIA